MVIKVHHFRNKRKIWHLERRTMLSDGSAYFHHTIPMLGRFIGRRFMVTYRPDSPLRVF